MKCDGYLGSKKTVFQVYAPRTTKLPDLLRKVRADFIGASKHWQDRMQIWVFVHNDHDGLPAKAYQALQDLERDAGPLRLEVWGPSEIESRALGLPPGELARLLGPAPTTRSLDELRHDKLRPILLNIKRQEPPADRSPSAIRASKRPCSPY